MTGPREVHEDHCQTIYVLCVTCGHRWFSQFETIDAPLFKLECPGCKSHNSFPSFVPRWYLEALGDKKSSELLT